MDILHYDILVVGGGPAGSSAAFAAASKNMRVLVVDKRSSIGNPVQCAEYIPFSLAREIYIPKHVVSQPVLTMKNIFPNGTFCEIKSPGLMIHRNRFDTFLMEQAVEKGAECRTGVRAVALKSDLVILRKKGFDDVVVDAKVIIGADGPNSMVREWMGLTVKEFVYAMQARVKITEPMNMTEVYFNSRFFGGYGWLFPKNDEANVGVGVKPNPFMNRSLSKTLDYFIEHLKDEGKIAAPVKPLGGGLIPVEPVKKVAKEHFVLAGDAAGLTHPITGAGISNAVKSGRMAGKWAAEAVRKNDLSILENYAEELKNCLGRCLGHAVKRRTHMEKMWTRLDGVINFYWPGCREYYDRL